MGSSTSKKSEITTESVEDDQKEEKLRKSKDMEAIDLAEDFDYQRGVQRKPPDRKPSLIPQTDNQTKIKVRASDDEMKEPTNPSKTDNKCAEIKEKNNSRQRKYTNSAREQQEEQKSVQSQSKNDHFDFWGSDVF
ncbi:uncharacterized protein LOC134266998 [Saccostrea cucullata]|uniref:uncharacterized protein LOC134266998 n=1 Tax=Saccostrea cuccullata TaxID=36930 RepID=UPI002ED414B0